MCNSCDITSFQSFRDLNIKFHNDMNYMGIFKYGRLLFVLL